VAKYEEAVYVLHAFQKKTQKTSTRDLELGKNRLKQVVVERSQKKGDRK
jgi:phage-related protein